MKKNHIILLLCLLLAGFSASEIFGVTKTTSKSKKKATTTTTKKMTAKANDTKPVSKNDAKVEITTDEGVITVLLYGDTPGHRDNFLKLAKEGYYDGVLFHRVIKDFMVQTGDPESKNAAPGQSLGAGDPNYTLEAEILYPKHYHKYGALAAARTGDQVNPERRSSGSQFYIVTGTKQSARTMDMLAQRMAQNVKQNYWMKLQKENMGEIRRLQSLGDRDSLEAFRVKLVDRLEKEVKLPEMPQQMREDYINLGGAPHLDGEYSVFGEVLSGMDVVEKIQNAETDRSDRPTKDIHILKMKVLSE